VTPHDPAARRAGVIGRILAGPEADEALPRPIPAVVVGPGEQRPGDAPDPEGDQARATMSSPTPTVTATARRGTPVAACASRRRSAPFCVVASVSVAEPETPAWDDMQSSGSAPNSRPLFAQGGSPRVRTATVPAYVMEPADDQASHRHGVVAGLDCPPRQTSSAYSKATSPLRPPSTNALGLSWGAESRSDLLLESATGHAWSGCGTASPRSSPRVPRAAGPSSGVVLAGVGDQAR
jgi:hypothetical protein